MNKSRSVTEKTTRAPRPASGTTRQRATTTVDQVAADPNMGGPIGIEPTKLSSPDAGSKSKAGSGVAIRAKLLAAMGVGALLGIAFLILTLLGLRVLAWSLLIAAMTGALVDIILVAAGFPGLLSFGSAQGVTSAIRR